MNQTVSDAGQRLFCSRRQLKIDAAPYARSGRNIHVLRKHADIEQFLLGSDSAGFKFPTAVFEFSIGNGFLE